jgi:hypothetical protein
MAEGEDEAQIIAIVDELCGVIEASSQEETPRPSFLSKP